MKRYSHRTLLIFLFFAFIAPGHIQAKQLETNSLILNELTQLEDGRFEKFGGDPYIIFPEIDQQICSSKGVILSIRFTPNIVKPMLLELFWSTDTLGFGEESKVFFTVSPQKNGANRFIIPLDNIASFTQIRLDFPSYLSEKFFLEEYDIISLEEPPDKVDIKNVFRVLTMDEALNPHIVVPYLLKSIKHGFWRLSQDRGFLFFWILLIGVLLCFMRILSKKLQKI